MSLKFMINKKDVKMDAQRWRQTYILNSSVTHPTCNPVKHHFNSLAIHQSFPHSVFLLCSRPAITTYYLPVTLQPITIIRMMLLLPSLAAVIAVATQTAALPSSCGATSPSPKAIYIISNEQTNAVIALPVAANGMVSAGTSTATGGAGSNSIDGSTKEPAAPDALVSQSALTIAGHVRALVMT